MKKDNQKIIQIITELIKKYPLCSIGRHLSTALDGYDLWSISDKEMHFALLKYQARREYDIHPEEVDDIEKIINEGKNLKRLREDLLYGNEEDD